MGTEEKEINRKYSFPLPPDMLRAEVYAGVMPPQPAAVLVLCPGCNWNGGDWSAQPVWRAFAEQNNIGLLGLSFASDNDLLRNERRGYYYVSQGSGDLLLHAIQAIYGSDLPVLLYGFSGGAHFASRFAEWCPDRVMAWCAYSAAWWDVPQPQTAPGPGIVSCGGADERFRVCRDYYVQGRNLGNPWLWITVPGIKHTTSIKMEDFVRQYFTSILGGAHDGCWVNIETKLEIPSEEADQVRPLSGWIPSRTLGEMWKALQETVVS